jgi:Flp pilus assembly protein TadD
VLWRGVRARCLAVRGRPEEAEALAREGVTLAETTDLLNQRADALVDLGIVLGRLERSEDALAAFGDAVRLYDQKGNLVAAGRVRSDLVMPARL